MKLFPHQKRNIELMKNFELTQGASLNIKTSFGFLSDAPGFGKSYCVIGLIELMKNYPDVSKLCEVKILKHFSRLEPIFSTTLILCSANVVHQWKAYFDETDLRIKLVVKEADSNISLDDDYDAIIVSHYRWKEFISKTQRIIWKRCVCDDFDSLIVSGFKVPKANFFWFLTANPAALAVYPTIKTRRPTDLETTFWQSLSSDIVNMVTISNSLEILQNSVNQEKTVDVIEKVYKCHKSRIYEAILQYAPGIKDLVVAGDVEGIKKICNASSMSLCEAISKRYSDEIETETKKLQVIRNETKIITHLERLKELKKLKEEWEEECKEIKDSDCLICSEKLRAPVLTKCCFNFFCTECFFKIGGSSKCPMCREKNLIKNIIVCETTEQKLLTKWNILDSIINKPGKYLIASDCVTNFYIPEAIYLHGAESWRRSQLKQFSSKKTGILIIDAKYNVAGINLPQITDIILFHEFEKTREDQIIGRALRIGRTEPLIIHRLIYGE